MAVRWKDKPKMVALAGTERMAATSVDGGPKVGGGSVAVDGDIYITPDQLRAYALAAGATIVTEASAFTADPATHAGLYTYVRAGGDVTFDNAESYVAGQVFNLRATAGIALVEDGVTLTPPAGGTLDLDAGMSVTIIMTSGTAGDVIGQTVPA